ncbi:MAG: MmgE/PrpD family protein [Micromonosporaceae bacterium]
MTGGDLAHKLAGAADELLERAARVRWDELDRAVRDATLRAVTDALGVASGAAVAPGVAASLAAYQRAAGQGSTVIPWWPARLPPADAAMALSLLIHAWDFDDTHDEAVVHACSVALPAALAAVQATGHGGRDLLAGVIAGIQVLCRVSLAVGVQHGVIRTAGLGSVGAAAAAARALGLDADGMRRAVSLALSQTMSPSSRQVVDEGALSKRHQPGFAVRHGVTAAFLAQAGVSGPAGWFAGRYGLAALAADQAAAARTLIADGWELTRLALKPIPACRYTHAAVDGTLTLTGGARRPDVDRVRVHVPAGSHHQLVARPWARRGQPVIDAQFSIPWLVGAALRDGAVELGAVAGALPDPEVEALARRVDVVQDQRSTDSVMTPVEVVLIAPDGGERSVRIEHVPGSPERPLSWDAVLAKAEGCLRAAGWDPALATALRDAVATLPDRDPREALAPFVPPEPEPAPDQPAPPSAQPAAGASPDHPTPTAAGAVPTQPGPASPAAPSRTAASRRGRSL